MFKEEYKKQNDSLTVSEDFKAQTIALMQRRAAELSQTEPVVYKEEKAIAFPRKRLARVCACIAVCVLSAVAININSAKLDRTEAPAQVPEDSGYGTKQAVPPDTFASGRVTESAENGIALIDDKTEGIAVFNDTDGMVTINSSILYVGENGIEYRYSYTVYSEDGEKCIRILANRENISYNEAEVFYKKNIKDSEDMLVVQVE